MYLNGYSEALPADVTSRVDSAMGSAIDALSRVSGALALKVTFAADAATAVVLASTVAQVANLAAERAGVLLGSTTLESWGQLAVSTGASLAAAARSVDDEATAVFVENAVNSAIQSARDAIEGKTFPWGA